LALHQQAADELGCNLLGGAGEEGLGEGESVVAMGVALVERSRTCKIRIPSSLTKVSANN